MQTGFNRRLRLLTSSLLALLFCGCEERLAYRMQFVDATTGQPLNELHVKWGEGGSHWNNRYLSVERVHELPMPGADATISLNLVYDWRNDITAQKKGYRVANVHNYNYPEPDSWYLEYADKDELVEPWTWSKSTVVNIPPAIVYQIPMYRVGEQTPVEKGGS